MGRREWNKLTTHSANQNKQTIIKCLDYHNWLLSNTFTRIKYELLNIYYSLVVRGFIVSSKNSLYYYVDFYARKKNCMSIIKL